LINTDQGEYEVVTQWWGSNTEISYSDACQDMPHTYGRKIFIIVIQICRNYDQMYPVDIAKTCFLKQTLISPLPYHLRLDVLISFLN